MSAKNENINKMTESMKKRVKEILNLKNTITEKIIITEGINSEQETSNLKSLNQRSKRKKNEVK